MVTTPTPTNPATLRFMVDLLTVALDPEPARYISRAAADVMIDVCRRERAQFSELVAYIQDDATPFPASAARTPGDRKPADGTPERAAVTDADDGTGTVVLQDGRYAGMPIEDIVPINIAYVCWLASSSPNPAVRDYARTVLQNEGRAEH